MNPIMLSLILDALMTLLLAVTIVYCWKLNRRIKLLQDSKGELAQLIRKFDASTDRASASIIELQTVGKRVTETIKYKLDKANYLANDLAFMIEKGSKLADRMESGIAPGRGSAPQAALRGEPEVLARSAAREPRMERTEKNAPAAKRADPQDMQRALADRGRLASKTATSLASVLEKASGRNAADPGRAAAEAAAESARPAAARRGGASVRLRSKAEQELMEALKSGS